MIATEIRDEMMGMTLRMPTFRASLARFVCGTLLILSGCASEDPSAEPVGKSSTAQPSPVQETTGPKDPPAPEVSAEAQAAETAFRTMTADPITPAEWEAANQRLQEIGKPALPVLVEGLKSSDQVKREMASTVLAWFGVEASPVADELIFALKDESTFVRANVATALLQMPEHVDLVVPVLAEFLSSDDTDLKRMAATNLAAIDADKARPLMPQLIDALQDTDRDVVYYSVQLLSRIGPDAAPALPALRSLETDDEELASAVETAILLIDPDSEPE